jgi:uncharacterized membrane protein HdeD (DUF308 family)
VIGIFGIVNGAMMIFASFGLRRWTGVILGVFGVLLGLILVANPVIGAATLPFVIGAFALVGGIMSIGMAFYERRAERRRHRNDPGPIPPSGTIADEEPGAIPSAS